MDRIHARPTPAPLADASRIADGLVAGLREGVADGFELAQATVGARMGAQRPTSALGVALGATVAQVDAGAARRAAGALSARLMPAHTRQLDARAKALLGAEVGGATGRRWMREAPTRPGFTAHPGVRACVRALAMARGAEDHSHEQ
jgi:hypothetical protein